MFDDFYIQWTALDRTLIIIIIIIIRVTKFLDSLFCFDKDDVYNENKNIFNISIVRTRFES